MNAVIAVDVVGLGKTYDGFTAIRDISFSVQKGEIFGLLGPNGAGKSTTLRILITTLRPTTGRATIFGHDVIREATTVRRQIGYVPQERAIDRFLTGREHLELLGALYHLPKSVLKQRISELLKLVELDQHADRVAKTYSGGMKRKLDIACGLLPNPSVLFLDEPTLGLDVQSRLTIWEYVKRLRDQGMTIVMTTNYLDEADQLCDRLAIIDHGQIRIIGSPQELKAGLGGDGLTVTLEHPTPEMLERLEHEIRSLSCVRSVHARSQGVHVRIDAPEKALVAIMEAASRIGGRIASVEYHRPRLDDVFMAYTGHPLEQPDPVSSGSSSL
ncbi:MAG: ATP-binding cassette domain-containing protein [Nitrospirae bacterium]|nr:MAG: ATP-binding cassette domain-containing protein [Nitrospirota bacterium]